jgi:NAD(P)-dependent dehydrogenase (short-subunit alcohol dehydrogenase family)
MKATRDHKTVSQRTLDPDPLCDDKRYRAAGKLVGKKALITGGDSGIGRAIAVLFAKEGAQVAINYASQDKDAEDTRNLVEGYGQPCLKLKCDISKETAARKLIQDTVKGLGGLDILINNAGIQFPHDDFSKMNMADMHKTFQTNIFSMFYLCHSSLKYLGDGSSIVNTASVTAYRGSDHLIDYSATKGAIISMTRSLARTLAHQGIRVNAVAPGPIWTPLIEATFNETEKRKFGTKTALGRAGQPSEVAPCYVFLASDDASYITGQVLHPNGGEIVNT